MPATAGRSAADGHRQRGSGPTQEVGPYLNREYIVPDQPTHQVMVREVEYLTVTAGRVSGKAVTILTIRPDEGSFAHVNLAMGRDQAWRLVEELADLFEFSKYLQE